MSKKIKNKNSRSFFDEDIKLEKLTKQGDPLLKLNTMINFEFFRPIIDEGLKEEPAGLGGRPPYDNILKFKMLILQRYYNISDEQLEFQVNDRLTFMRFLGLSISDDVPDCNTIRYFREKLASKKIIDKLFNEFDKYLNDNGFIANKGSIIDASFVEVPKQRNNKDENDEIKKGKIPEEWKNEKNKNKLVHKDTDARWTKKNNETHYGYKNHVKVDIESKLIKKYTVTDASVHDSQVLNDLIDETDKNKEVYADSAYTGQDNVIKENEVIDKICEKGCRYKKLTEEQILNNKNKSKIRVRVEHVFGFIENNMNGSIIKTIGKIRACCNIGLMNLTYNLFRYVYLQQVRSV